MRTTRNRSKALVMIMIKVQLFFIVGLSSWCHAWLMSPTSRISLSSSSSLLCTTMRQRDSSLYLKERRQNELPTADLQYENKISENKEIEIEDDITIIVATTTAINNHDNDNSIQQYIKEKLFLGIQPTPEILAIMAIYFVEGALGLARLAQTFYLKDTLHLGPAELSALTGLFTLPWTIKPLYGFLSDGLPLFGYRRRSYLILCGVMGALSYTALGSNFGGLFDVAAGAGVDGQISLMQATIASFVISSGCIAFSDVVADGIVVQRTRDSDDPKVAGEGYTQNKWFFET